ncbi:MAG: hypothetical protein FWF19_05140 [Euryarchaeota archaeon]|nr:hypothetical protein [Euryarchaeota archaeon]
MKRFRTCRLREEQEKGFQQMKEQMASDAHHGRQGQQNWSEESKRAKTTMPGL